MSKMRRPLGRILGFRRNDDGNATIEAVLWIPFFILFFMLVVNVSYIFFNHARALKIVQDGNRAYSTGRIATASDNEDFIEANLQSFAPSASVQSAETLGIVYTQALLPIEELVAIGNFRWLQNYDVAVVGTHYLEY